MLQLQKLAKRNVPQENHLALPGLLLQVKTRKIQLKIVNIRRLLMVNYVPFHFGIKTENILDAQLTIQTMEKPGAQQQ